MRIVVTTILCLIVSTVYSGNVIRVSGRVLSTLEDPLIAAVVTCSDLVTITDELGYFTIQEVDDQDSLTVSHIGYATAVIRLSDLDSSLPIVIRMSPAPIGLDQVEITTDATPLATTTRIDLTVQPVSTSQEILRRVPGLFIAQHAGGGKAEQIFLRGFDIDHGTDISISVDGMPVNMVSHAHGQGYSDLHFLIPETVEKVDFAKGPYDAKIGNFGTAGQVAFKTKDDIKHSTFGVEYGQFNTTRVHSLLNLIEGVEKHHLYVASEYLLTDGPVESPQDFSRFNIMAKYTGYLPYGAKLSAQVSRFSSQWDASGQIPQRAVDSGVITRFGAIDDTEGGFTDRTNATVMYTRPITASSYIKSQAYFIDYNFELYSNFTFFLNNPIRGDQIRQKEHRTVMGGDLRVHHTTQLGDIQATVEYGMSLRNDIIDDVELSRTANRVETLSRVVFGDVHETNIGAFAQTTARWQDWSLHLGARLDRFDFRYHDQITPAYDPRSTDKAIFSPKLRVEYSPSGRYKTYLKAGYGFHSNDSRTVLALPVEDADPIIDDILPAARGADLGVTLKPSDRLLADVAVWILDLEQEFVYVGDEGIVEPSGRTLRRGIDVSMRYEIDDHWYINTDFNYTVARSVEAAAGEQYIPLAPLLTSIGGVTYQQAGWTAGIRYRHIMDRPANEDNTITALGYWVTDANVSYLIGRVRLGLQIENLFNVSWNEAQFATTSRLRDEPTASEEIHFTPGVPFFARGSVQYMF